MDETLAELQRIAYDDRIVGLDREDARRLYNRVASADVPTEEFEKAAGIITDIARKNRIYDLGRRALGSAAKATE